MASIIQAAKWMDEGKQVRRSKWYNASLVLEVTSFTKLPLGEAAEQFTLNTSDLLADDWEIAPQP